MTFKEKLLKVQVALKAPKDMYNDFGKYKYRSCESILEAVKPLLSENKLLLNITDDIIAAGDRIYVKATATLIDAEESTDNIQTTAFAREPEDKKGMDDSQVTGTASSYARKYALNAMFLIDDTKDADTNEYREEAEKRQAKGRKKEAPVKQEEKPVKKEEPPAMNMLETIEILCNKNGIPEAWLCDLYKVGKLEDLKPASQKTIIKQWDRFIDKYADEFQQGAEGDEEYYNNILDMYGGQ